MRVVLVDAMEHRPQVGLIQTLPVIVNGSTLFSRLQQFANRLYGPMRGFGLAAWHGSESNYWGHNAAILRRSAELAAENEKALPQMDAVARLCADEKLLAAHRAMIEPRPRRRDDVDVDLAVGVARLEDVRTPQEVRDLLSDRELNAVLADPRSFERLASIVARARGG